MAVFGKASEAEQQLVLILSHWSSSYISIFLVSLHIDSRIAERKRVRERRQGNLGTFVVSTPKLASDGTEATHAQ